MPVDLLQEHVDCRHTQVQCDIISRKRLKTLFTLPPVWSCFYIFLQYHKSFSDGWRVYQSLCARPTQFLLPTLTNFDSLRGALLRLKSVNAGLDVETPLWHWHLFGNKPNEKAVGNLKLILFTRWNKIINGIETLQKYFLSVLDSIVFAQITRHQGKYVQNVNVILKLKLIKPLNASVRYYQKM